MQILHKSIIWEGKVPGIEGVHTVHFVVSIPRFVRLTRSHEL